MIKTLIVLIIMWLVANCFYVVLVRALMRYNNSVTVKFNAFLETCNLCAIQFGYLKSLAKWLLNEKDKEQLQERKSRVLRSVVNHLNQNLITDLGIKTTHPATTKGVDVWIYLAKKPDELVYKELEDYFIGVLAKYSSEEFALDYLAIEMIGGAGWVAKFDVKPISEANYNRMARASEVVHEERFDEDLDIW